MQKNGSSVPIIHHQQHCRDCHWSWNCPPTSREIKEGIVEGNFYCCEPRVLQKLNGEMFPRLIELARSDGKLCGSKGRYWAPIEPMLAVPNTTAFIQRTRSKPTESEQSKQKPVRFTAPTSGTSGTATSPIVRKPYKVV